MSALWLRCLAVACLMALAISAPIAASWLRRSRLRRLAWRIYWWRLRSLRRVRVPRDGEPLNEEERAAELLAMRGWADHAGTAALAWPELQIEAELREGAE